MRSQKGTFRALIAIFVAAVFLAGCSSAGSTKSADGRGAAGDPAVWMAAYGLDGLGGREIIDTLDRLPVAERPDDLLASVRADQVVLSRADGGEVSVPLPADEFYVSVAPYTDETHECFYHSLTTCLGELRNADVRVTATDADGTQVIAAEDLRTFDNGFVGMWLPRGFGGTLTIERDGRTATVPVATGADDPTCLTTARLT
ncbi:CueP family metal-binding protein [Tomitella fengzijianii]|uniref:Uncharacterized protein n=1 Tax=Tomitella fengzijianii TaxID=2597660 RepID=A0A516X1Z8_9ACTN|nr:CueP family metal-binding protein [Tomitella fengzijianii]QDQ97040.1 hypothetical protein FO059_06465 [Tomitella fengzijianii]